MPGAPLTSSTQSSSENLSGAVVHRESRTIDLSQQRGAVDHHVLDQLRNALHLNDFFVRLSLANNPLRDNCVAAVCAIIKDQNYLSSLSLENCDLLDKDVTYYIVPALLSRAQIRHVDLSKNTQLTDTVAEALARLIREGELQELRLIGVPLTRKSGKLITNALAQNGSLGVCELPYTIGFEAIDEAARFIQRNLRQKQLVKDQETNRSAMEQMVSLRRDAQTGMRVALAMEMNSNRNGQLSSVSAASRSVDVRDDDTDAPLAMLDGQSVGERHQLARYYTEHGRKNAVLIAPPSRGALPNGRRTADSAPTSARGTSQPGSRGLSRSKLKTGGGVGSRTGTRASQRGPQNTRLPPNPPLLLPPLADKSNRAEAAATGQWLIPEAEWRSRVDPATAHSMRCLDVLKRPTN